jgi:hypothetical protein
MARTKSAIISHACTCCGETKKNFYKSNNPMHKYFGEMPVCKDCMNKEYERLLQKYKDEKTTMYIFTQKFDLPFSTGLLNGATNHAKASGWSLQSSYIKQLNSLGGVNNHGVSFENSEQLFAAPESINKAFPEEEPSNFELTSDIVRRWGKGLPIEDYEDLENEFEDWIAKYECDSKAMETLIKQICFQQIDINKRRISGEKVDQQLKTLQDLLGSSNLKPVQESGINSNDQITFGTLLKKWENEEPVPEPDPEWKDVDGIGKYIRVWFLGHLCKIMGITNEYSKEYEDEMEKLRVYAPEIQSLEDIDEGE